MLRKEYWLDKDMQKIIGSILRYGVLCSAICVIVGGILLLADNSSQLADYSSFHGARMEFRSLDGIFNGVLALKGDAIIQLGAVILMATPIARVLFSLFAFAVERDYLYVVITLIVLSIIFYSMLHKVAH